MQKSVGYLARESALIVFSILVALGVNEWRVRAAAEAEEREAYAAVYAELTENLALLEDMPAYHGDIAKSLFQSMTAAQAPGAAETRTPMQIFTAIEFLQPATVIEQMPQGVAWDLAKQRGAAARFDYDIARRLSLIYDSQQASVIQLYRTAFDLLVRPEMFVARDQGATLAPLVALFEELSAREETLVQFLRAETEAMRKANPKLEPAREG